MRSSAIDHQPEPSTSYTWTFTEQQNRDLPINTSLTVSTAESSPEELLRLIHQAEACSSESRPSDEWLLSFLQACSAQGDALTAASLLEIMQTVTKLRCSLPQDQVDALLRRLGSQASALSTQQLADAVWCASELKHTPDAEALSGMLQSAQDRFEDFLAADLCRLLCAVGCIEQAPPAPWVAAAASEVQFQLTEFLSDFKALDLAQLISGIADLQIPLSAEFNRVLMKAVYTCVHTIEDKGAVDFALAKLNAEKKSLLFDPRWTHEELNWLPRRERDKRRIIKQEWQRTQWGGW